MYGQQGTGCDYPPMKTGSPSDMSRSIMESARRNMVVITESLFSYRSSEDAHRPLYQLLQPGCQGRQRRLRDAGTDRTVLLDGSARYPARTSLERGDHRWDQWLRNHAAALLRRLQCLPTGAA